MKFSNQPEMDRAFLVYRVAPFTHHVFILGGFKQRCSAGFVNGFERSTGLVQKLYLKGRGWGEEGRR